MQHAPPRLRSRLRSQKAFTIVEVAIAAGVLALVLSTSIITLQSGFRTLDVARGTRIALVTSRSHATSEYALIAGSRGHMRQRRRTRIRLR